MDAFKQAEIERMRLGGNDNWRTFFESHADNQMRGITWEDATIADRYGGEVGEEYKERLSAKVEGREYVPGQKPKPTTSPTPSSASNAPTRSQPRVNSNNTPLGGSRTQSPAPSGGNIKVDDRYFSKLGERNSSRPADLPPSQGGKYGGFGNTASPSPSSSGNGGGLPGLDELQKDPVAALSKGFGWFTSTVTKTAKTVNNDFIQPTAKQLAESDFAAQARIAAEKAAKAAQAGTKTAQEGFNRFVEGPSSGGYKSVPMDDSKRAFWDDFSSVADQRKRESSSIGTSALGSSSSRSGTGGSAAQAPPSSKQGKDEWDDW